jgi:hypothetical protein
MNVKFKPKDNAVATLTANTQCRDSFTFHNPVEVKCYDKDGNLKWEEMNYNVCTDEGLTAMLNYTFHATTQIATWYVGLAGAGTKAVTNTAASHAAWSEITAYTGTRPAWVETAASAKSISNTGNLASFSINGDATVAGAGIWSDTSGTAGVLFAVVDFASSRTVASGDTLTVLYTITCADS